MFRYLLILAVILISNVSFAQSDVCVLAEVVNGVPVNFDQGNLENDKTLLGVGEYTLKVEKLSISKTEGISLTITRGEFSTSAFFEIAATHPFLTLNVGQDSIQAQCWLN